MSDTQGTAPKTPDTVEIGQVWRDNDHRSKGAGEFTVVDVGEHLSERPGVSLARVRRGDGRKTHIRVDRLLGHSNRISGYTYIGRQR